MGPAGRSPPPILARSPTVINGDGGRAGGFPTRITRSLFIRMHTRILVVHGHSRTAESLTSGQGFELDAVQPQRLELVVCNTGGLRLHRIRIGKHGRRLFTSPAASTSRRLTLCSKPIVTGAPNGQGDGEVNAARQVDCTRMGDRVHHSRPQSSGENAKKSARTSAVRGAKRRNELLASPSSVLAQLSNSTPCLRWISPKTGIVRYHTIVFSALSWTRSVRSHKTFYMVLPMRFLPSQDDSIREPDEQAETHKLLSKMTPARFSELTNLGKRCADFTPADSSALNNADG